MPTLPIEIDVIIVNWNSGEKTLQAIEPYLTTNSSSLICNIIVLDNASTDNSTVLLSSKSIHLINNPKNLGFGCAVNKGIEQSKGKYVLLLNPDTKSELIVLEKLLQIIEANPLCASIGPQQRDKFDKILRSCGRFPDFLTSLFDLLGLSKILPTIFKPAPIMIDWNHQSSMRVDHIMGSYMLLRRSALEKVGYFDDDFFLYYEDLDLSKRLQQAGYYSYFDASVSIQHEGGSSGNRIKAKRLFYSLNSRRLYWKKHLHPLAYLLLIFFSLTLEHMLRLFATLFQKKDKANRTEILKAYYLYFTTILK